MYHALRKVKYSAICVFCGYFPLKLSKLGVFLLRNGDKTKYQIVLVFCSKTSLDFRYNAWHCASNLPCFETKSCLQFLTLYFITVP